MRFIQRLKNLWKLSQLFRFNEKGQLEIYGDDIKEGIVRELVTKRNIVPKNIDRFLTGKKMATILDLSDNQEENGEIAE